MAAAAIGVDGAVEPPLDTYENRGTVRNETVNAKRFVNSGKFEVIDLISSQPYSTLNTSFYTNKQSGRIVVSDGVGIRFQLITNNFRELSEVFVNSGHIEASGGGRIEVEAKTVISPGRMISTTAGRVLIRGRDVDLERGAFSALETSTISGGSLFSSINLRPTNYLNSKGVEDVYWGAGIGGTIGANPPFTVFLSSTSPFPAPPGPLSTPTHEVVWPALQQTGFLNSFTQNGYASHMWTNDFSTNHVIQVVLVNTNTLATNIQVDVRFARDINVSSPMVRFSLNTTNLTTSSSDTNVLYFVDTSASQTNVGVATNIATTTFRPRSFTVERGGGLDTTFAFAEAPNAVQAFDTFFPAGLLFTNLSTTNYRYWAYGAQVGSPETNAIPVVGSGGNLSLNDATNKPGRVEIFADQLNLTSARIQAENTIQISTTNLISSAGAALSAPNIVLDVAKTAGTLSLTNLLPSSVTNFHGFVRAYSLVWTNTSSLSRERYTYQVLLLDASLLNGQTAVQLPTMRIKAPNIVVQNKLNAARSFVFDGAGITFKNGTELRLNPTTIPDLRRENFPSLVNLTNEGIITVPQLGDIVGDGAAGSLENVVNDGILLANTLNIRCANFESSGTNGAIADLGGFIPVTFPLISLFDGGTLDIFANSAKFEANAAAGKRGRNLAVGDISIAGNSLKIINQDFLTPARLILDVTNLIGDGGIVGSNLVTVGNGFSIRTKPGTGDLLGTSIESIVPHDLTIEHVWAGDDRGKTVAGYSNNVALGRLTLSTTNLLGQSYVIKFAGANLVSSNAMYIDLIDLRGSITNENLSRHLQIDPNLKIYFANASPSVDFLLTAITNATDTTLRERLIWVPDFAGPNSSQLVSFVDAAGRVVQITVNSAKFNSQFLDSDGDGVVNASEDRLNSGTPFDGVLIRDRIGYTGSGANVSATITWRAAKETDYRVEISSNLAASWTFLSNSFNSNTVNGDVTFTDSVPVGTGVRFYRIGYKP